MIGDISAVIWKEWREYLSGSSTGGRGRSPLIIIAVIVIFSLITPFEIGQAWFTTPAPLLLAGLYFPMILVISVIADSFAGERERHTLETLLASRLSDTAILLGKIVAALLYGWVVAMIATLAGGAAANFSRNADGFHWYSTDSALAIICYSLLFSGFVAAAGALVSMRSPSSRQAQQVLGIGMVVLIFGGVFGFQALSASTRLQIVQTLSQYSLSTLAVGLGILLLLVDSILAYIGYISFQRTRLILD